MRKSSYTLGIQNSLSLVNALARTDLIFFEWLVPHCISEYCIFKKLLHMNSQKKNIQRKEKKFGEKGVSIIRQRFHLTFNSVKKYKINKDQTV